MWFAPPENLSPPGMGLPPWFLRDIFAPPKALFIKSHLPPLVSGGATNYVCSTFTLRLMNQKSETWPWTPPLPPTPLKVVIWAYWGLIRSKISKGRFGKNPKNPPKKFFQGSGAEFPYLGITAQNHIFLPYLVKKYVIWAHWGLVRSIIWRPCWKIQKILQKYFS